MRPGESSALVNVYDIRITTANFQLHHWLIIVAKLSDQSVGTSAIGRFPNFVLPPQIEMVVAMRQELDLAGVGRKIGLRGVELQLWCLQYGTGQTLRHNLRIDIGKVSDITPARLHIAGWGLRSAQPQGLPLLKFGPDSRIAIVVTPTYDQVFIPGAAKAPKLRARNAVLPRLYRGKFIIGEVYAAIGAKPHSVRTDRNLLHVGVDPGIALIAAYDIE